MHVLRLMYHDEKALEKLPKEEFGRIHGAFAAYVDALKKAGVLVGNNGLRTAIVALYDALLALTGSVVVAINRAVALAEVEGAAAGLAALDTVQGDPRLAQYQPFWAARAELLSRLDNRAGAGEAYTRAIGLEADPAVRRHLQKRLAALG